MTRGQAAAVSDPRGGSRFTGRRTSPFAVGLMGLLTVALLVWRVVGYRPVLVAGTSVTTQLAAIPRSGWPLQGGLRLHVFNTGMVRISSLMVGASSSRWRPVPAFVLEHPSRGLVVYDCGMSMEVAQRGAAALPWVLRLFVDVRAHPERLLDVQMQAAGLDPAQVRTVVLSHAHFDHVGRIAAFPQATFVGGAGIRDNHRGEWTASVPSPLEAIPVGRWQELPTRGTPPYATFDGNRDLFGDSSLILLPGGGHTREDLLTLVLLPQGPALLAGDAIAHREWLSADDVQRVSDVPERAAAVRNQVRALLLADPGVLLLPGHDLAGLPMHRPDLVLHRPEWFSLDTWPAP